MIYLKYYIIFEFMFIPEILMLLKKQRFNLRLTNF